MSLTASEPAPTDWRGDWSDRLLGWRDRLLASPTFQRRAAAFIPTRRTARRRARALFDLVAGFVYSQVLAACVELRIFDLLVRGPLAIEELARRLELPLESARCLLDAAVSLQLLQRRRNGRYGLGPLGAPMVGNAAVTEMINHHSVLYGDLADPVGLLRGSAPGALAGFWSYGNEPPADGERAGGERADAAARSADTAAQRYSALMASSQSLVAAEVLDAYPFHRHRRLLDIGGGDGTFLMAASQRVPSLELILFDLPAVTRLAHERFERARLGARARIASGNFLADPLPRGADLATLIRVIHDHDDDAAMTILRSACRALGTQSTLLLAEPMAGTAGAEPMGDAYFGLYLRAMGRGRPRSRQTLTAMLQAAGFDEVRAARTRLPLQTSLLVARTTRHRGVQSQ